MKSNNVKKVLNLGAATLMLYIRICFLIRASEELHFAFSQIRRVLKPKNGLNFFLLETFMINPIVKVKR